MAASLAIVILMVRATKKLWRIMRVRLRDIEFENGLPRGFFARESFFFQRIDSHMKRHLILFLVCILAACGRGGSDYVDGVIVFDNSMDYPELDLRLSDVADITYIPLKGLDEGYPVTPFRWEGNNAYIDGNEMTINALGPRPGGWTTEPPPAPPPPDTRTPMEKRQTAYLLEADPIQRQIEGYRLEAEAWRANGDEKAASECDAKRTARLTAFLAKKQEIRERYPDGE